MCFERSKELSICLKILQIYFCMVANKTIHVLTVCYFCFRLCDEKQATEEFYPFRF